ncbi:MAG: type VI secretion system baseplate subunit TssF, partial [Chitinophagaceae bacterium]|nr:type VI secretion system baseplate subunit TssF [Chitinophagaceae bacterium]
MAKKINSYSQEAIKARMLQNAVKIWGLESTRAIDPFVKLLIDAFSAEIFKVSNEINSINSRILEKLARMLTPTLYTTPQPAHALATTYPSEALETLRDYNEFFIKQQFSSSLKTVADIQIEVPFTPIDNVRLVKMRTAVIFAGDTCYNVK